MKVLPVMDILNGVVVHAKRGERGRYRPLKTVLCQSSNPVQVASALEALGFSELYVADLDAIQGGTDDLVLYQKIMGRVHLNLIVDAGISTVEKAEKLLEAGVSKMVIGTETLSSLDFVGEAIKSFGKERVIVSIDMKEGKLVSVSHSIESLEPVSIAETLEKMGLNTIILLDLTRVGTQTGIDLSLVKAILKKTNVDLFVGGGVGSMGDLKELDKMGVSGALVATILHTGRVTSEELKLAGFL